MKKVFEFVNKNKAAILIVTAVLTVVLLAVLFFIGGADISVFANQLFHTVIVIAGVLVFAFIISKIIPNKDFVTKVFTLFSLILGLFFILNVLTLNISEITAAIPVCVAILLSTAARLSE